MLLAIRHSIIRIFNIIYVLYIWLTWRFTTNYTILWGSHVIIGIISFPIFSSLNILRLAIFIGIRSLFYFFLLSLNGLRLFLHSEPTLNFDLSNFSILVNFSFSFLSVESVLSLCYLIDDSCAL